MLSLVNELDAAAVIAEEEWCADGSDLIKLLQETGPNVACFSISKERKISKDFPSWEEQDIDNSEINIFSTTDDSLYTFGYDTLSSSVDKADATDLFMP